MIMIFIYNNCDLLIFIINTMKIFKRIIMSATLSSSSSTSLLQLLNTEQRSFLDAKSHQITVHTGDCLFKKGEKADHIYLVNKGKITLYRLMPNGDQKVFKVFLASGVIAEMAIFMQPRIYPMNAHVDQTTSLTCYNYQSFNDLFQKDPKLALKFITFISNRVGQLMNSLDILTQVNASQRLVMHFAEIYSKQKQQGNRFTLPYTKKILASQLGITPETLSRLLNKLKLSGLISESGACITVPDFGCLCREVDLVSSIFEKNH